MEDDGGNQILIVTSLEERPQERRAERGLGESLKKGAISAVSVSVLRKNMEGFFGQLREILDTGAGRIADFEVAEVEVSAQITGDGKVCLMGSGVQVGVQGGVKFVLKRTREGPG